MDAEMKAKIEAKKRAWDKTAEQMIPVEGKKLIEQMASDRGLMTVERYLKIAPKSFRKKLQQAADNLSRLMKESSNAD